MAWCTIDFNGVVVVQNYLERTGRGEWAKQVKYLYTISRIDLCDKWSGLVFSFLELWASAQYTDYNSWLLLYGSTYWFF